LRKDAADPSAAFTILAKRKRTFHQVARGARRCLEMRSRLKRLAIAAIELGLVVERVHLAHAAVHEQLNDATHLRRMMQPPVERGASASARIDHVTCCEQSVTRQKLGQSNTAQAPAGMPQELTSRDPVVHGLSSARIS